MYFEELAIGMEVIPDKALITKEDMLSFALKYDNRPLHVDESYALSSPFRGLIAPGVMSFMAVWAKYLEKDFFKKELLAGKSTRIEWLAPVYAGDELSSKAVISRLESRNEKNGVAEITLEAYNQNGVKVLINVTEAVVKKRTE